MDCAYTSAGAYAPAYIISPQRGYFQDLQDIAQLFPEFLFQRRPHQSAYTTVAATPWLMSSTIARIFQPSHFSRTVLCNQSRRGILRHLVQMLFITSVRTVVFLLHPFVSQITTAHFQKCFRISYRRTTARFYKI